MKSTKRKMLLVLIQYTHHVNKQSISGGLLKRQDRCNDKKRVLGSCTTIGDTRIQSILRYITAQCGMVLPHIRRSNQRSS